MAICDRQGPIVESAVLECVQVRVVLTRSSALDRETQAEHRLRVTALDAGLPARTGQLDITVVVLDANDNHPVFEHPEYEVSFCRSPPPPASVTAHLSTVALMIFPLLTITNIINY